jgi:hypothetical protein
VDDVTVLAFSALLNVALTVVAAFTPVAPIPGAVELTLSAGAAATITMLNGWLALCGASAESVTCTVKLKVPAPVGVPVIAPVLEPSVRPPGREPAVTDQAYG